jgi:glutathione peroxidase
MQEAVRTREVVTWKNIPGLNGQLLEIGQLKGKVVLVVNVASRCGLTPQYGGLERLQRTYRDRGFTVLGVPCNQFAGQEPGAPEEIEGFCRATYGTTFPMTAKLEVNGRRRHLLFQQLTAFPDAAGTAGEIEWNFEKFLVAPSGEVLARFRPTIAPDDGRIVEAIEAALAIR